MKGPLLFEGADWNFDMIQRAHDVIEKIAVGEMGLSVYPNQIEVITSEQMLDAYAATGMPIYYSHWSFGKSFVQSEGAYRKGYSGLAYEIVINSSPCISYIMEGNTMTMQTLVIAHAAFGHNHFFKNNYAFREWTDPAGILDYLVFARSYIAECEDRYGVGEVERVLDAAHALMAQGVNSARRRRRPDLRTEEARQRERRLHDERMYNELWRTLPASTQKQAPPKDDALVRKLLELPQENILYFLEKNAPKLAPWQREILRIVRLMAQYFYQQRLTKVMNEGTATFVHYAVMNRLHETGQITDGAYLEFLASHTNVVMQPAYNDPMYSGINPYALGFSMMRDLERACLNPDDEDREWLPDIAGCGDAMGALREIWANFRDESFILQYLSPKVMRDFRLFDLVDDPQEANLRVDAIHNERGYRRVRSALARSYEVANQEPQIEVHSVDLSGDRKLILRHNTLGKGALVEADARKVLRYVAMLWGYDVALEEVDTDDRVLRTHTAAASGH
jgi:spore cortex formation protein SpoVR/YcgB (stage V sporulation)